MSDHSQESQAPQASPSRSGAVWILVVALVLGLVRFWQLGHWSLWIDEAYTVADWGESLERGQIWNPLGYRAIRATVALLGGQVTEWNLRLLPALAGWACIPLSYWAFSATFGRRRAAWIALLLALSSWHVFWSQSARFYTLAMALSLVGSGVLLRGCWQGSSPRALLGLALAAAAAAFHPTAALMVPALALAPWWVRARSASPGPGFDRVGRVLMILAGAGLLLGARWLWSSYEHHLEQKATLDLLSGPRHLLLTSGYFFTPLVGAAALVGAAWSWRARDSAGLHATAVCLVVLGGALLVSSYALMTAQYMFCLLPWALALGLAPLDALAARPRGRGLAAVWCTALSVSAAAGLLLYMTSRGGERPRWREAYAFVDGERVAGDLVLGMGAPIGELYLGESGADPRRTRTVSPLGDWFPEGPRRWNRFPRRIWLVIRPQWLASLRQRDRLMLETWLADDCRLVRSYPVEMKGRDLELLVYVREP